LEGFFSALDVFFVRSLPPKKTAHPMKKTCVPSPFLTVTLLVHALSRTTCLAPMRRLVLALACLAVPLSVEAGWITSFPSSVTAGESKPFSASATGYVDPNSHIISWTMQYRINGGAWTAIATTGNGGATGYPITAYMPGGNTSAGTMSFTFSTVGTYEFRAVWNIGSSYTDLPGSVSVTVVAPNSPPTVSVWASTYSLNTGQTAQIYVRGQDVDGNARYFNLDQTSPINGFYGPGNSFSASSTPNNGAWEHPDAEGSPHQDAPGQTDGRA
jgi:hypothetical protein